MTLEQQCKIENRAILLNLPLILVMSLSGLYFGKLADSQPVIFDGQFSMVIFLTTTFSLLIKFYSNKKSTRELPHSEWILENLYLILKISILLGLLAVSLYNAVDEIYLFINQGIVPEEVDHSQINYYYIIKITAFLCSMAIYTRYYKKLNSNSDYIKTERGSVFIDGIITISIFLGFIVLGRIELVAPISDSIILLFISMILVISQVKELKEEVNKLIGERVYKKYEEKYLEMINNMDKTKNIFIVEDVYIYKLGVQALVELTLTINKEHSVDIYDITLFEVECKALISNDGKFLEPKLYTYYIK